MTYLVCDMYIFLTSYQVHVLMQFNVSFQVFNLSERRYDISKLNHQVSNNNNNFFTWKMLPSGKVLYGMLHERLIILSLIFVQVLDFGWPDHLAPPLERLCR